METAFRNCAIVLLSCFCISTAKAQRYSPIDLYKLQGTNNFPGAGGYSIESASRGQVAGASVIIGPVFVRCGSLEKPKRRNSLTFTTERLWI